MKIILQISALLILVACSAPSSKKESVEISLGAISYNNFPGGLTLKMINTLTLEVIEHTITSENYKVSVPNGTWDFIVVGFDGPGLKAGQSYCGKKLAQVLTGTDVMLTIPSNHANCSEALYVSMLPPDTSSKWNVALWDNSSSKWAP